MNPPTAVAPILGTLGILANWTPANAGELAEILAGINDNEAPSIVTALAAVLGNLASAAVALPDIDHDRARLVHDYLTKAAELLTGFTAEAIDRARQQLPEGNTR